MKEEKEKKITKEDYEKLANQLARDFCPVIKPCKECDHPVINGYCCTFCGSVEP